MALSTVNLETLVSQLGLGALLGLAGGWVLARLMAKLTLPERNPREELACPK